MDKTQSLNFHLSQKAKREEMITNYLKTVPEGATPKMISFYTRIPQSTVRGMLSRGITGIEKTDIHGLYHSVQKMGDDGIFLWNFHNLLLVTHLPKYDKQAVSETHSSDLINFEFNIGAKSKNATARLSTPKVNGTDYPLNLSSITLAVTLFKELIRKHANTEITNNDIEIKTIELNKDYQNIRLDGVNSITMENLIEQFKAYQKKDKLRIEHKLKVPVDAEQLFKILGLR
jgi:hypothetical protein